MKYKDRFWNHHHKSLVNSLMKFFCPLITFLLLSLSSQAQESSLLQAWNQEDERGFQPADATLLEGKHVIFVPGVMHGLADITGAYFADNIAEVERLGATHSYVGLPSWKSVPDNASELYDTIIAVHKSTHKPIILVGHSKGAAEILYVLLKHPQLLLHNTIDSALLFQGSIGGSLIAERIPFINSWAANFLGIGFNCLTESAAYPMFNELYESFKNKLTNYFAPVYRTSAQELHQNISNRIFYLRSQTQTKDLSFGVKLVLGILWDSLDGYQSDHDGMVATHAQLFPHLGTDLGVVPADHISLTVSTYSNITPSRRQSCTRIAFKIIKMLQGKTRENIIYSDCSFNLKNNISCE